MLLKGYKVDLGDLGSFYIGLNSKGTATAEDFNPAVHIKEVKVNWSPGIDFLDLKKDADFRLVSNRRAQRLLLKAVTNGDTMVDISKEEVEDEVVEED
jgi:hypothetical protein